MKRRRLHVAPLVIVADPPWKFADTLPGKKRGAAKHYRCQSVADIVQTMRPAIEQTGCAVLFLWRVAAMQAEALEVIAQLGFELKSEIVWQKLTRRGRIAFGMGRYTRMVHETCLIATRGNALPAKRDQRSMFAAPKQEHSRKPDAFYRLVERLYPQSRRVECYARTVRAGWEQHGNELGKWEEANAVRSADHVQNPKRRNGRRAVPSVGSPSDRSTEAAARTRAHR